MRLLNPSQQLLIKVILAVIIGLQAFLFCQPIGAADIAAFGDSITEGIGSKTGGYPPKLAALLNTNLAGKHVVDNHGEAGEVTAWGNGRIHAVLESKDYDYILILEGTNDIYLGLSLESTKYYLEAMINKSKILYGVSPLIANLLPDTRPDPPANQKNIETTYNPMIKNIARKLNVPFVNLHSAVKNNWEKLSDDKLHPNDSGYKIVAKIWYNSIAPLLRNQGNDGVDVDNSSGGCFIETITVTPDRYMSAPLAIPASHSTL